MKELPDGAVSLILTDPPYGIRYQNQFSASPHPILDGDSGIDYKRFARESYRILAMNSHAYFLLDMTVIRTTSAVCRKPDFRLKTV